MPDPTFGALLGQQAAGNAVGGIMGLALGAIDRKAQVKQAGRLQELEIKGQKQMTDYNMQKQLQMWKDTSYGPQVEQMKAAGINPALLYGMSGGGAQTTGTAQAGISGQQAAPHSGAMGMGINGAQLAMMKTQINNMNADTEKKKVKNNKTRKSKHTRSTKQNSKPNTRNRKPKSTAKTHRGTNKNRRTRRTTQRTING